MSSADVLRRLADAGWVEVGRRGSHRKFKHPSRTGHVCVPHPRRDIPTGTLRNIYRQAGWAWN